MIDARDNDYMDRSPCIGCENEKADKTICSRKCERLAAYRNGESWKGLAAPVSLNGGKEPGFAMLRRSGKEMIEMEETKKIEVRKSEVGDQKSEIGSQKSEVRDQGQPKNENSPPGRGGRKADGVCESSDNQQSKACVICHDPDKKILNKRSQTCGACYQAWNTGKITHPTLGKFTPSLTKSKTTKTKKTEPARRKSGEVKETPVGKKLKIANESMLKSMADAVTKEVIAEIMAARVLDPKAGLILNLDKFLKIKTAVYDTAEKYFVTPEHVVIGLLGEALATRESSHE